MACVPTGVGPGPPAMQNPGSTAWIKIEGESGTALLSSQACAHCITWKMGLHLLFVPGSDWVDVTIQAEYDGFPNYEVYIDGQEVLTASDNSISVTGDGVMAALGVGHIWRLAPPTDVTFRTAIRVEDR
jgi:hypothetical protein